MSLPSHIITKPTPNAGNGLYTTQAIGAGEEVFRIDSPLGSVLDSPHLQNTCANCFRMETAGIDGFDSVKVPLSRCLGCKVVKYCSKDCQTSSWKSGHRYGECKIFAALYPNVLPNTVRLVLRILLRRQNRSLSDASWSSFLYLQPHTTEFQAQQTKNEDGLTVWQTIELMGLAATKYSGTTEQVTNVQGMICRVLVNTHTLTTPTLDPLGLCLAPQSALLNHSCTPNAYIVFSGQKLAVRSLCPIKADAELTISYIDTTQETPKRQSELQSRYFFACSCSSCRLRTTNGVSDPPKDQTFQEVEARALDLQLRAATSSPSEGGPMLQSALELLGNYPPYRQPYAAIQHNAFLNALVLQAWDRALHYALKAYFHTDPVHYPLSWHPVRIVRRWVLMKLVMQLGSLEDWSWKGKALENLDVKWATVIQGLAQETGAGIELSHGQDNAFTEEFRRIGIAMGTGEGWRTKGRPEILMKELEVEWVKLRKIADGL